MTQASGPTWSSAQSAAITTRGMGVLVSAGAGSGKTSVLVERVVQCLAEPDWLDLTALLIVTFTEAAAAEMRERISDRIEAIRQHAAETGDVRLQRHMTRQLGLLDQAQISTLHSFCMDIVRRNFFVLGLDPTFDLMEDEASRMLRHRLLQERMERQLAQDQDGTFRRMLERFGASDPTRLFELVLRLDTFAGSQPDPTAWLDAVAEQFETSAAQGLGVSVWMTPFRGFVSRKLRRAAMLCERGLQLSRGEAELARYEAVLSTAWDALAACVNGELADPFAAAGPIWAAKAALDERVSAKEHPFRETVKAYRKEAQELLEELMVLLGRGEGELVEDVRTLAPDVACLVGFAQAFSADYQQAKAAGGKLDFQDLEHYALTALQHPESGEKHRLQARFREVFVDEYQDVSPIQDALVAMVTRDEENLFVVGDVKQSIYRFRMAEPNLFLHQYNTLGQTRQGRVIDLSTNYRSRGPIVSMVNFVFEQLFQPAFGDISYDDGARMLTGAQYPDADTVATELYVLDHSAQKEETDDADPGAADLSPIEQEALLVAQRIGELMETGATVYDKKLRQNRPLQYRDIVILLRSAKGRVESFVEVFGKAGIPVYAATSTGFYDTVEIRWLTAALRAVDNPRRDIELAAMLRSPLIGLSDQTLGWIRTAHDGAFIEALETTARSDGSAQVPDAAATAARRATETLSRWRQLARTSNAETVLRSIMKDTALSAYLLAMPDGRQRMANVVRLHTLVRNYDESNYDGLHGFVKQLQAASEQELDMGEARSLAESEDVVRIMTIHQSKGLEFPVVFVANLGKPFYQGRDEQSFPLHSEFGFGPQLFDADTHRRWKTFPWFAVTEANTLGFLAEEARVLYVAMTRARERLILVGATRNLCKLATRAANWLLSEAKPLDADGLLSARSMLDWVLAALLRHPSAGVLRDQVEETLRPATLLAAEDAQLSVTLGTPMDVQSDLLSPAGRELSGERLRPRTIEELVQWLGSDTDGAASIPVSEPAGTRAAVEIPGKVSATELRRLWTARNAQGHHPGFGNARTLLEEPRFVRDASTDQRAAGTAFHAVMQHLPLDIQDTDEAIAGALDGLSARGVLSQRDRELVRFEDIQAFLRHPIGEKLRRADQVFREQPFFTRIPVGSSFVVVQGVIDCLARVDGQWLLIDYKTDRVDATQAPTHAREYTAQISTYLQVARGMVGDESVTAWLYFVKPGVAIPVEGVDVGDLFRA